MALEARAFSTPGPRTVIRTLPDSGRQRAVRWALLLGLVLLVGLRLTGHLAVVP